MQILRGASPRLALERAGRWLIVPGSICTSRRVKTWTLRYMSARRLRDAGASEVDLDRGVEGELEGLILCLPRGYRPPERCPRVYASMNINDGDDLRMRRYSSKRK
jgi:hypothetical protein